MPTRPTTETRTAATARGGETEPVSRASRVLRLARSARKEMQSPAPTAQPEMLNSMYRKVQYEVGPREMTQTATTGTIANASAYNAIVRRRASGAATRAATASSMITAAAGPGENRSGQRPPL